MKVDRAAILQAAETRPGRARGGQGDRAGTLGTSSVIDPQAAK